MNNYMQTVFMLLTFLSATQIQAAGIESGKSESSPMEQYLEQNCPDPQSERVLLQRLREQHVEAERYFVSLIEKGPDPQVMAAERKYLEEQFAGRQSFLKEHLERKAFTGTEVAQELADESRQTYYQRKLEAFTMQLTYRALEGLKAIHSRSSREYLGKKAKESEFPLHDIAAEFSKP